MSKTKFRQRQGISHRKVFLNTVDQNKAVGWLEDDFHHFGLTIQHDGESIVDIRMIAARTPWLTCAGAGEPLKQMIGRRLFKRASDIGQYLDMRKQCTHIFDLAGLLCAHIANASSRKPQRLYHLSMNDRFRHGEEDSISSYGPGQVRLALDGEDVVVWDIDRDIITAPVDYAGVSLLKNFRAWTESLPQEEAEYANIIRRFIMISGGRTALLGLYPTAASQQSEALCFTYQPERSSLATRNENSIRDYNGCDEGMLKLTDIIP